MPELTFTQLKNKVKDDGKGAKDRDEEVMLIQSVCLEEVKQGIKKEPDSETEGDPELANVLAALSQNGENNLQNTENDEDSDVDVEKDDENSGLPVPKNLFMNQHTYQAKVNEICKAEPMML